MLHQEQTPVWQNVIYQTPGPVRVGGEMADLYVAVVGRFISRGRFTYEQVSPSYSMHVIESGEGVMEMDGVSHPVAAGDAFTFFPGHHIRYYDKPGTPWRYTWFILEGAHARAAFAHAGVTEAAPLTRGGVATLLEPIFQEIEVVYRRPQIPAAFAIAAAWRLVDALGNCRTPTAEVFARDIAETARFLMNRDDMGTLSVEAVARQLGISRTTLFRKFRERYRVSPKGYLDSIRMNQARQLLRQSRSSVKEIAASCGFASAHYFSRAFKKHGGLPPKLWRRRNAKQPHD